MIISILTAFSHGMGMTAHAGEMLDSDYIESEIWQDMWLGRGDDGTELPEASFKHHLLLESSGNFKPTRCSKHHETI